MDSNSTALNGLTGTLIGLLMDSRIIEGLSGGSRLVHKDPKT